MALIEFTVMSEAPADSEKATAAPEQAEESPVEE
jgi:hypothetical protein